MAFVLGFFCGVVVTIIGLWFAVSFMIYQHVKDEDY